MIRLTEAIFRMTYSKCAKTIEVHAPVKQAFHKEITVELDMSPEGWQQIGNDLYCEDHTIEITRKLVIDGEVIADLSSPWGVKRSEL